MQRWQFDAFVRDTEGEPGVVVISDILGNPDGNQKAIALIADTCRTGQLTELIDR